MEKGAKILLNLMLLALGIGMMVIIFLPSYRNSLSCIIKGQPEQSPIWQSNTNYYADIGLRSNQGDTP